jgi:hypothetical protein
MPRTVKQEPPSAPPRRSSDALIIREGARTLSPPLRGRKQKPRKEDAAAATSELADAEAARARGAPVVKLEDSSDDDLYRPTPPCFGDAGQGSSRWTPGQSSQQALPPQDDIGDSSNDDGDDYTRFYRHFGM